MKRRNLSGWHQLAGSEENIRQWHVERKRNENEINK